MKFEEEGGQLTPRTASVQLVLPLPCGLIVECAVLAFHGGEHGDKVRAGSLARSSFEGVLSRRKLTSLRNTRPCPRPRSYRRLLYPASSR
eukprot:CAMPEP_0172532144 /NCGR_PEP_ID=MMETSP1067-20121228/5304_1 /TAXON_ID=265564 ORGANISM="Thalassiosira punctigera, Strain Tpunct2005C2" /NCGR_SAMPLE_ID=MMETSP1067 /ASSEMBLY_ACC=CAM_ASM_000444 /LENGTH=89 /DNA_ID=CAMNT_0013316621 /DNA_START=541 /DNA_END=806 /DNA_ORIENTATION=+